MGVGAVTQKDDVNDMVSHLSWLMLYSGIKSIELKGYRAGMSQKVIANMEPYEDAPEPVRFRGVVIKDEIGHIMGAMGINNISISDLTKAELKGLKSRWKKMEEALISTAGSFQE
jgi:hypothetical protein